MACKLVNLLCGTLCCISRVLTSFFFQRHVLYIFLMSCSHIILSHTALRLKRGEVEKDC